MNLSEMKRVLSEDGIQLTKSLGQNFLHDGNQLRRILAAAELNRTDRVLEIGPGLGPLTDLLLEGCDEVLAIEKDARLVRVLRTRFAAQLATEKPAKFRLLHDDALEVLKREPLDLAQWKMVSNLPYSVASPILVELAQNPRRPIRIVATLQMEVARRVLAVPGGSDYGVLSLLLQLDYAPGPLLKIPASCFFPPPDVDSACIVLHRRDAAFLEDSRRTAFYKIVKRAFSQRRKMMLKLLRQDWPGSTLEQAFAQIGLSPQVRAEQVSLEQFVALTLALTKPTSPND